MILLEAAAEGLSFGLAFWLGFFDCCRGGCLGRQE